MTFCLLLLLLVQQGIRLQISKLIGYKIANFETLELKMKEVWTQICIVYLSLFILACFGGMPISFLMEQCLKLNNKEGKLLSAYTY